MSVLDDKCGNSSLTLDLEYPFFTEINETYKYIQHHYHGHANLPHQSSPGWRDDFCSIKWRNLPSLHRAMLNSLAIAYFLLPHYQEQLFKVCQFISNSGPTTWFSTQNFNPLTGNELFVALRDISCNKAIATFQRYWSGENLY